jgi:hypothetical protein
MLSRPDGNGNETKRLRNEVRGNDANVLANLVSEDRNKHLRTPSSANPGNFPDPTKFKTLNEPFDRG